MSCTSTHCVTCGDDGVEMTVHTIDERNGLAVCSEAGGGRHTVQTALVEPVAPGDRLLVHAGTAIAMLEAGAA